MTLEGIADLIRASSGNLSRRMEELNAQSYGQLMNVQNDLTDVRDDIRAIRADVGELRRDFDLAETVAAMRRQIETLEAEVAVLKRRA